MPRAEFGGALLDAMGNPIQRPIAGDWLTAADFTAYSTTVGQSALMMLPLPPASSVAMNGWVEWTCDIQTPSTSFGVNAFCRVQNYLIVADPGSNGGDLQMKMVYPAGTLAKRSYRGIVQLNNLAD